MSTQQTTKAPSDITYVVARGDSLSKIAQQFYGDAAQYPRIAQANGIDPAKPIQVGQRLRIPDPDVPPAATPTAQVGTPATPVARVQPGFTALNLNDWRVWAGGGLLLAGLYFMFRSNQRRR